MNMKVVFDTATIYSKFIHDSSIKLLVIMLILILFLFYKKNDHLYLTALFLFVFFLVALRSRPRELPIAYDHTSGRISLDSTNLEFQTRRPSIVYVYRRGYLVKDVEYFIGLSLTEADFDLLEENLGYGDKKYTIVDGGFKHLSDPNSVDQETYYYFHLKGSVFEGDLEKTIIELEKNSSLPVKRVDLSGKQVKIIRAVKIK